MNPFQKQLILKGDKNMAEMSNPTRDGIGQPLPPARISVEEFGVRAKPTQLGINFINENVAIIDSDGDSRIQITFQNAATNLSRRAKAEIVLAARTAYSIEVMRITDGNLMASHVYNEDGSIGAEAETAPTGPII